MDTPSGLCIGCWRTIDEIVKWGALNDEDKQAVCKLLDQRRVEVVFSQGPGLNAALRT
jgi:uncharacterized protein